MYILLKNPRLHVQLAIEKGKEQVEYIDFDADIPSEIDVSVKGRGKLTVGTASIKRGFAANDKPATLLFSGSEQHVPNQASDSFGCHVSIDTVQFDRLMPQILTAKQLSLDFWLPVDQSALNHVGPNGDCLEWDTQSSRHVELHLVNLHIVAHG